jgi:hypothetical protein
MRRPIAFAVAALVALVAESARAGEPTADQLIARGLELRRQSKPEQALELFMRANALAPSPRTFGQIGLVQTTLEHWLDAEAHLITSLAAPDDAWVRKNRVFLDQALGVCKRRIGELVVSGPGETRVAVDGRPVGTLPALQPIRLAAGNVLVTATGAGFKDFSKTVAIEGGAKSSLAIVLDPVEKRPAIALSAPVPLPPQEPLPPTVTDGPDRRGWRTIAGTGLIAAGAGLLAWGIAWVAVDGSDTCPTSGPTCTRVYDTRTTGWILTAGGAAAAAVGTGVLVWGRRGGESPGVVLGATPTSLLLRARF